MTFPQRLDLSCPFRTHHTVKSTQIAHYKSAGLHRRVVGDADNFHLASLSPFARGTTYCGSINPFERPPMKMTALSAVVSPEVKYGLCETSPSLSGGRG